MPPPTDPTRSATYEAALPDVVARSFELLADVRAARPRTRVIAAGDEIDITYGRLVHAIDS